MASHSDKQTPAVQSGAGNTSGKSMKLLNYTFYNIVELSDVELEEPREVKKVTPKKKKDGKYPCGALWLNNNSIADLKDLCVVLERITVNPYNIIWIDLSMNSVIKIDLVLLDMRCLKYLYLHGNHVEDLTEVDKLAGLPDLQKFTLHGNPVEKEKDYRNYLVSHLPNLRELDFAAVTKSNRENARNWTNNTPKKRKKKRVEQD